MKEFKESCRKDSTLTKFRVRYLQPFEDVRTEAKKAAVEARRAEWINRHGSGRLKRAYNAGYEVGRIYAVERAGYEAPDFEIDFYHEADWNERNNPTITELDELDKSSKLRDSLVALGLDVGGVEIVWLKRPGRKDPRTDDDYGHRQDEFLQCSAVVIRDFLGRYDLIKPII